MKIRNMNCFRRRQQISGRQQRMLCGCLFIYVMLSLLPFGFMTQAELAKIANPSTAGVLEHLVGPWGSYLMNIGLLIAVLFSWLAWTMIAAQIPQSAALDGTFPKIFARENSKGTPSVSLWVTSIIMQLAMLLVYFSNNAWNTMLSITGVMVLPAYIFSTLYLWKLTEDGEYQKITPHGRFFALVSGIFGTAFGLWLVYAAGLKYLFMAFVFIALGIPVFMVARRQNAPTEPCFSKHEKVVMVLILLIAFAAIYAFTGGLLTL